MTLTTGHSLGAATSSMLHILLVNNFLGRTELDFMNLTFAPPMIGNLELKKFMSKDERFGKMFHFTNVDDPVPASMFIPFVYNSISFIKRLGLNTVSYNSWLTEKGIKWILENKIVKSSMETKDSETFEDVVKVFIDKSMKRKTKEHLFQDVLPQICMPIGTYFCLVENTGNFLLDYFEADLSSFFPQRKCSSMILLRITEIRIVICKL